jgi:hypothetical protein
MAPFSLAVPMLRSSIARAFARPWFARTTSPKFRPLVRAEFACGALLGEALFLHSAGFHVPAACCARVAVERRLMRLALITPEWQATRRSSINDLVRFLQKQKALPVGYGKAIDKFADRVNGRVHGRSIEKKEAAVLVAQAQNICAMIDEAARTMLRAG